MFNIVTYYSIPYKYIITNMSVLYLIYSGIMIDK